MELIDLRSDTVTKPTPGMRKAMAAAEVGDDVWHEDPSFPEAGVYRGRDEWEAYARQFIGEFSDIRYEQGPGETVESGDDLVVNILIHGRGTASGAEFDLSAW